MRLKPLPPGQLSPDRRVLHDEIVRGMNAHLSSFISAQSDGALVGPFPPMLHFPEFGKAAWANVRALTENSTLPKAAREVVILAVGAAFGSRYELYAHEIVAGNAGVSPAKIATIVAGQRPHDLDTAESICYDVATVLAHGKVLPDATYQHALQTFGEKQMAELVFMVATYCQLAVLLNAWDIPAPEAD